MKKLCVLILMLSICFINTYATETLYSENITSPMAMTGVNNIFTCDASGSFATIVGGTGTVTAIGFNQYGQLGNGGNEKSVTPVNVQGVTNVGKIVSGKAHTLALKKDGTLSLWGRNDKGQLGTGDTDDRNSPITLPGMSGIMDVAAGDDFSIVLKYDGSVWVFGDNTYGQLGIGTIERSLVPVQLPNFTGVAAVGAGNAHVLAVMSNGNIYAWGKNTDGQLGDGTTDNKLSPVRTTSWDGINSFALGEDFTAVLKNSGTITVCGKNDKGQLGLGNTTNISSPKVIPNLTGVYAVAAGKAHMSALSAGGATYSWGDNSYGQLGGTGNYSVPTKVQQILNCIAVTAGDGVTLYTSGNGLLYMMGNFIEDTEVNVPQVIPPRPDNIVDVGILINNEWLIADTQPIIVSDRTLVPLRAIFEKLGATLEWEDSTKTATAIYGEKTITITINDPVAYVNDTPNTLDVPALIVDSRTMVPVRFIAESLDCKVDWNGDTRTVIIEK